MAKDTRIQKAMADLGFASRRKSEEIIAQDRVKVNGHPAEIGMKVDPKRDIITVDGEALTDGQDGRKFYIAMYKPRGYVTTMSDELGRKTIADLIKNISVRVYPIGRLDKLSEGLILLTNDGEFANMMMHPKYHVTKLYRVTVASRISEEQLIALTEGVDIDSGHTLPAIIKVISNDDGRGVMEMTIREGKNRQIRKMCEAVGLNVKRLRRNMIGPVKLGMLQPGEYRELTGAELSGLRSMAVKNLQRDIQDKNTERNKAHPYSRGYKRTGASR